MPHAEQHPLPLSRAERPDHLGVLVACVQQQPEARDQTLLGANPLASEKVRSARAAASHPVAHAAAHAASHAVAHAAAHAAAHTAHRRARPHLLESGPVAHSALCAVPAAVSEAVAHRVVGLRLGLEPP